MPFPDESDDDVGFVPPLPPDDRLWRHPSERSASHPAVAASDRGTVPTRPRRTSALVFAGAAIVIAVAGLATASMLSTDRSSRLASSATDLAPATDDAPTTITEGLSPALVHVVVDRPAGRVSSTGVFVRSDGHLVTSATPLVGATSITVRVASGESFNATVVGTDEADDVAVLDIATNDAPTARIDQRRAVGTGDHVYIVGASTDSNRPRVIDASIDAFEERIITTDGAVLLDMVRATSITETSRAPEAAIVCTDDGTVIGMITTRPIRTATPSPSSTLTITGRSTTWVTPNAWIARIVDEIIASGSLHRAWLGVVGDDTSTDGAVVTSVVGSGPADRAGILVGDVIRSIDDEPVDGADDLAATIRLFHPGDQVRVGLVRHDVVMTVDVVLSEPT